MSHQDELALNPGLCLELINLGRCLQDPKCLAEFTPDDWYTEENRQVFLNLTTLPTLSEKRNALAHYLVNFGVDPRWIEREKQATEACTESQRANTLEMEIANNALLLCEDLRNRRYMGDRTAMSNAIRKLQSILEDRERPSDKATN